MIKLCLYGSVAQYPENDLPALGAESFSVTMSGVSAGSFLTAQVDIIQSAFSPTSQEIERATKIIQGYEEHAKKGIGAFNLDGKMVDMPVVKWAQRLLAKAERKVSN